MTFLWMLIQQQNSPDFLVSDDDLVKIGGIAKLRKFVEKC